MTQCIWSHQFVETSLVFGFGLRFQASRVRGWGSEVRIFGVPKRERRSQPRHLPRQRQASEELKDVPAMSKRGCWFHFHGPVSTVPELRFNTAPASALMDLTSFELVLCPRRIDRV
jgi:hypothetical protein